MRPVNDAYAASFAAFTRGRHIIAPRARADSRQRSRQREDKLTSTDASAKTDVASISVENGTKLTAAPRSQSQLPSPFPLLPSARRSGPCLPPPSPFASRGRKTRTQRRCVLSSSLHSSTRTSLPGCPPPNSHDREHQTRRHHRPSSPHPSHSLRIVISSFCWCYSFFGQPTSLSRAEKRAAAARSAGFS